MLIAASPSGEAVVEPGRPLALFKQRMEHLKQLCEVTSQKSLPVASDKVFQATRSMLRLYYAPLVYYHAGLSSEHDEALGSVLRQLLNQHNSIGISSKSVSLAHYLAPVCRKVFLLKMHKPPCQVSHIKGQSEPFFPSPKPWD